MEIWSRLELQSCRIRSQNFFQWRQMFMWKQREGIEGGGTLDEQITLGKAITLPLKRIFEMSKATKTLECYTGNNGERGKCNWEGSMVSNSTHPPIRLGRSPAESRRVPVHNSWTLTTTCKHPQHSTETTLQLQIMDCKYLYPLSSKNSPENL